jgi:hypothetical protein
MLKSLFLTAVLFVASTLLMAKATFSSPLPQGNPFPEAAETQSLERGNTQSLEAADANPDVADSPKQTADDKRVDLSNSPKKAPVVLAPRSTYPQPPHPYNNAAIKKFDEELYGAGN